MQILFLAGVRMRLRLFHVGLLAAVCAVGYCRVNAQSLATAAGRFAYSGDDGPGFWSKFDGRCAAASTRQSPVDIEGAVADSRLKPLDLVLPKTQVVLVNPGYTVQANAPGAGFLMLDSERYTLLQFHFHSLSEHTVTGRHGVLELHLVFENDQQKYAVVGVIFKLGRSNQFMQQLVDAGLPETTQSAPVTVTNVDINGVLSDTASYYTYAGSLTTPPCSENVTWLVLKNWTQLSSTQLQAFRNILGNDFRPVQNRHGREVRMTSKSEPSAVSTP